MFFTVTGGEFKGYYRFLKGFYGLADIPTNFPGTDRQNTGIQTPRLARRHHNCNQRNNRKTRIGSERNNEKIRRSRIQATPGEIRTFQERG